MSIDTAKVGQDWANMNKRLVSLKYVDQAIDYIDSKQASDAHLYKEYLLDEEFGVKKGFFALGQDDIDEADRVLAGYQTDAENWGQGLYDALPSNFWFLLRADPSVPGAAAESLSYNTIDVLANRIPHDFADLGSTEVWQGTAAEGFRLYYSHLERTRNSHAWLANQIYRGLALAKTIIDESQQSLANIFATGADDLAAMLKSRAAQNRSGSPAGEIILLGETAAWIISAIPTLGTGAAATFAISSALLGYAEGQVPAQDQAPVPTAFKDAPDAGNRLSQAMTDVANRTQTRWDTFDSAWLRDVNHTFEGIKDDGSWLLPAPSIVHGVTPKTFHDESADGSW